MLKKEKSESNLGNQAVLDETDMSSQLKKISDHLVFLEKKIDNILAEMKTQKPQGQSFGNRGFQRRPGQFGRPEGRPQYGRPEGRPQYGRSEGRPGQFNRPEGRPGYYQGSGNQGYAGGGQGNSSGPNRPHRSSGHSRPYENRPRSSHSSEGNFQKKSSH